MGRRESWLVLKKARNRNKLFLDFHTKTEVREYIKRPGGSAFYFKHKCVYTIRQFLSEKNIVPSEAEAVAYDVLMLVPVEHAENLIDVIEKKPESLVVLLREALKLLKG